MLKDLKRFYLNSYLNFENKLLSSSLFSSKSWTNSKKDYLLNIDGMLRIFIFRRTVLLINKKESFVFIIYLQFKIRKNILTIIKNILI
jgi:hypothetical protein